MRLNRRKKIIIICLICIAIIGVIFFRIFPIHSKRPNILMISMDALRPDYMSCYGYKRNTTPNIDKFVSESILFTQAISHSSHTAPSNASLITSTYPNTHQVKDWGYRLNPAIPTVPEILRSNGYETAFISDHFGFFWMKGFKRGFDTFNIIISTIVSPFNPYKIPTKISDITDLAITWLRDNKNKKFFLWVYYLDPHGPYVPPNPYNRLFLDDGIYPSDETLPICNDITNQIGHGCIPYYLKIGDIKRVDFYISQYCGEIREIDNRIQRLLEELKRFNLDKNTIIIITSDHGEAMGEHNQYFSHTEFLYDNLIRVPLILKYPKLKTNIKKIRQQVRIIDIAPTILDFIEIRKPVSMLGESLRPLILGETNTFSEFAFSQYWNKISIRTERWKLIYNADTEDNTYELYDLRSDPNELNNLSYVKKEQFEFLKQKIDEYINTSLPDSGVFTRDYIEDGKQLLRSLGYIQ